MLTMSDSRHLSRTLAAIGLVVGPLLFFVDTLIDPAWDDNDAVYLAEVAGNRGAFIIAEVAATVGSLLLIPGTIGVMRLMRGRRVTLGQVGAGLLTIGLIGLTASLAFITFDLAMADFENREAMAALREEFVHSGAYGAYWLVFFFAGVVLGSALLAIALVRRRIVPLWSPILLVVAVVVWFFEGQERLLSALSFLILAAALAPLAMRIWSLSNDEWERWELSLDHDSRPRPSEPGT